MNTEGAAQPEVLFLIRSLNRGGAERQLVNLACGLHARGWSVAVAVFYPNTPLESELIAAGIPVYSLNKQGRWDVVRFLVNAARLIRRIQPRVLHTYLPTENVIGAVMKLFCPGTRLVWGVRSSSSTTDVRQWGRLTTFIYGLQERIARIPDRIVVNSHAGKALLKTRGVKDERVVVVANGIDTACFRLKPEAGLTQRREWGLTADKKIIGLVARLDPIKDHDTFLRAAALLARRRSDVHFVCVGGGSVQVRTQLEHLAAGLGLGNKLTWAGGGSDMIAIYNALDINTCSSYAEGFPNSVAEAMACETPCVVTDVGDCRRIVGDTGVVVPPRDSESLAMACETLLSSDYRQLGARARRRIEQNFGLERMIEETAVLLSDYVDLVSMDSHSRRRRLLTFPNAEAASLSEPLDEATTSGKEHIQ